VLRKEYRSASPSHTQLRTFGRELGKVVDSQQLLESDDFVYVDIEPVSSERLALDLLELLTQRIVFMRRNNLVKLGKQSGVFPRFMRRVHSIKCFQVSRQAIPVVTGFKRSSRCQDAVRQAAACLVLRKQHFNQVR